MIGDAASLRARLALIARVDGLLEESLHARRGLAETLAAVLDGVRAATGARAAFVRTFDEDLALALFVSPAGAAVPRLDEALARTAEPERASAALPAGAEVVLARPIDVAGEWFGSAGLVAAGTDPGSPELAQLAVLLADAVERIDDHLYAIRAARQKHRAILAIAAALRSHVLSAGLGRAVAELAAAVPLARLLLVYLDEEERRTLHVQLFEGPALQVDTTGALPPHPEEAAIRREARAYLADGDPALPRRFDLGGGFEQVLVAGVARAASVGRLLVTPRAGTFNTWDRDLLGAFASLARQRVADFNREWRALAASFCPDAVERLLQDEDYAARWLAPREAVVGVLYADIAGFTRVSEQVLRAPSRVASLVETWGRAAVDLVWAHGGVFDKMVGDCVVALFGPPFDDAPPGARLAAALRCAVAIRAMTAALPERPGFADLRDGGLGVATGVHLAPLFVGRFGPNGNYTGFSSGMNNAARLQHLAARDEILVMDEALAALPPGHGFAFGEARSARVKNVAEPLCFRALGPLTPA